MSTNEFNDIMSLMDALPIGTIGISTNFSEDNFDYFIAVSSSKEVPSNMEELFIETQSYATFISSMDKIQEITKQIFEEWLPKSEFEFVKNAPELEIYPDGNSCKICIPIVISK